MEGCSKGRRMEWMKGMILAGLAIFLILNGIQLLHPFMGYVWSILNGMGTVLLLTTMILFQVGWKELLVVLLLLLALRLPRLVRNGETDEL